MSVVGAVLTGGASRRMGRTKALVDVGGVPMGRRVADALLQGGCSGVVLVGGSPAELSPLGFEVVPDERPGDGPLAGVSTALRWATSLVGTATHAATDGATDGAPTHVLVAACDLALLDAATVTRLIDAARTRTAQDPETRVGAGADAGAAPGDGAGDVIVAQSDRPEPALALWNVQTRERVEALLDAGVRSLFGALDVFDHELCAVDPAAVTNINRVADLALTHSIGTPPTLSAE